MNNYISRLDEIDKWLFDSFGILPGACSSTENLRHTTARMVAEALWPKKNPVLTGEDVKAIFKIADNYESEPNRPKYLTQGYCQEILNRFNEQRKK